MEADMLQGAASSAVIPAPAAAPTPRETPLRIRTVRALALERQEQRLARKRAKVAVFADRVPSFKPGDVLLLSLPTENTSFLMPKFAPVMVVSCTGEGAGARYVVLSNYGVVGGKYDSTDDLKRALGPEIAAQLSFKTLADDLAELGEKKITLTKLRVATLPQADESSIITCTCRAIEGRRCADNKRCPCAKVKQPCHSGCHIQGGSCFNYTLCEECEVE